MAMYGRWRGGGGRGAQPVCLPCRGQLCRCVGWVWGLAVLHGSVGLVVVFPALGALHNRGQRGESGASTGAVAGAGQWRVQWRLHFTSLVSHTPVTCSSVTYLTQV
jgi:hypothetical protein